MMSCCSRPLPLILTLQMTGLERRPSHLHRRRALVLVCVLCIVVVGVVCGQELVTALVPPEIVKVPGNYPVVIESVGFAPTLVGELLIHD